MNNLYNSKIYILAISILVLQAEINLSYAQSFSENNFSTPREITTISNTTSGGTTRSMIAFADFNADGKNDVVKVGVDQIMIMQNIYTTGDISNVATNLFTNLTPMATKSGSRNVIIGDINGDNKDDILVGCDSFASIFINNSTGGVISFNSRIDIASYGSNVELFDIDGDGALDLIHSKISYFTKIGINLNDNTSGLFSSTAYDFTTPYGSMEDWTFADFDGNGSLDFFSARANSNSAYTGIYLSKNTSTTGSINFGTLNFKTVSGMQYASYGSPKSISSADIDGDTKPDVLVQLGNKTHFFLNSNGGGTFDINNFSESNATSQNSTNNFGLNFGVGDINDDGKIDIISPGSNSSGTFILKNNSTISNVSFSSSINIDNITNQTSIMVDLDGDSHPEIINARYYSDKIYVVQYTGTLLSTNSIDRKDFAVYPNPAINHFTIKTIDQSVSTYTIYTLTGQQVLKGTKMLQAETHVDISSLQSGVYILEVSTNKKKKRKKIIKG